MMREMEQTVKPGDAFETYNAIVKAELDSMIDLFNGLLFGSRSGDEVNQQMDQHLANMDRAAEQYWQQRNVQPVMMLSAALGSDLAFDEEAHYV